MAIYRIKGKKADRWYVDFYNGGQRIRQVLGSRKDAEDAETLIKASSLRGELQRFKKNKMSLKELCEKYLGYQRVNGKRSVARDVIITNSFMRHFKHENIVQINPLKLEEYKKKRLEDGVKSSTVNRELACIKHMFNLACRWKILHENPFDDVKFLEVKEKKIRILSKAEADLFVDAAAESLKPIILTALSTGMRLGEILGLRWSDINFVRYSIHIRAENSKSKKSRDVPVNGLLAATLKELIRSSEFVFESPKKSGEHIKNISGSFRTAIKKSGIEKLTFHALRHTAASWMIEKCGIDLVTVKEILGHSDIKTTMIYCHPSQESKRKAVEGLEKILTSNFYDINRTQMDECLSVG